MAHVYEVGYGTYEESEYTQLTHTEKYSQSRFEDMILQCVVKAAAKHVDEDLRSWTTDSEINRRKWISDEEFNDPEREIIPYRTENLKYAIESRLKGDEESYHYRIRDAYIKMKPNLSYQTLHESVVDFLVNDYGFERLVFLRRACFSGWDDLSVFNANYHNRHRKNKKRVKSTITTRATSLVRKYVYKSRRNEDCFSRGSAESKWRAIREKALQANPAACETEDEALCKELGVEFIPYNHPDVVKARENFKDETINVDDELLRAFGVEPAPRLEDELLKAFGVGSEEEKRGLMEGKIFSEVCHKIEAYPQPKPDINKGGDCFICAFLAALRWLYPDKEFDFEGVFAAFHITYTNHSIDNGTPYVAIGNSWGQYPQVIDNLKSQFGLEDLTYENVFVAPEFKRGSFFSHNWNRDLYQYENMFERIKSDLLDGVVITTINSDGAGPMTNGKFNEPDHLVIFDGTRTHHVPSIHVSGSYSIDSEVHMVCSAGKSKWINIHDLVNLHGLGAWFVLKRVKFEH